MVTFCMQRKPERLDYSLRVMEKEKEIEKRSGEQSRRNEEVCVILSESGPG